MATNLANTCHRSSTYRRSTDAAQPERREWRRWKQEREDGLPFSASINEIIVAIWALAAGILWRPVVATPLGDSVQSELDLTPTQCKLLDGRDGVRVKVVDFQYL